MDCAKDNSDLLQIQISFFKWCYFNSIWTKISLPFQFHYLYCLFIAAYDSAVLHKFKALITTTWQLLMTLQWLFKRSQVGKVSSTHRLLSFLAACYVTKNLILQTWVWRAWRPPGPCRVLMGSAFRGWRLARQFPDGWCETTSCRVAEWQKQNWKQVSLTWVWRAQP